MGIILIINYLIYLNCTSFTESNIYFFYLAFLFILSYLVSKKELSKDENEILNTAKILSSFELEKKRKNYRLSKRRKEIAKITKKIKNTTSEYFIRINEKLKTSLEEYKTRNLKLSSKSWIESQGDLRKEWLILSLKNDNK